MVGKIIKPENMYNKWTISTLGLDVIKKAFFKTNKNCVFHDLKENQGYQEAK